MPRVTIAVPPSTPERLVFPLNTSNQQFDTSFYHPGFTDGRAGVEEINQVVAEIQVARQPFVAKIKSAYCCYIVFIFLGLFAMIALNAFLVASVGPGGAFIGFFVYMLFVILRVSTFRTSIANISKESKATAQVILDKYAQSFSSRGLRWFLPVYFPLWIELHKDYLLGQGTAQPIYMPPGQFQPTPVYPPQGQQQFPQPQPQFQNQQQFNQPQPQFQDNYYQNQNQQPTGGVYNA